MNIKTRDSVSAARKTIILIYGLPGSGKTTLAKALYESLGNKAIWFNADKVRSTLSADLGFSEDARLEQARRMGCLASLGLEGSNAQYAIVDFVNPTIQTFSTFMKNTKRPKGNQLDDSHRVPDTFMNGAEFPVFSIFMNTLAKKDSRFADTAALFEDDLNFRKPDVVIHEFLKTPDEFPIKAPQLIDLIDTAWESGRYDHA
jgi:DNA polymerase III delta prime subunit